MYALMIGRIFQGVVVGMMSGIVMIMVKEISPISVSGSTGAIQNLAIASGFLFGFGIAYFLSSFMEAKDYLPYAFGFTLLTTILQQILLMTVLTNETPKYLLMKGRDEEALELIKTIYK